MTPLKVLQIEDSLGFVLPKETLERLKLKEGDMLYLSELPEGSMLVTTSDHVFEAQMRAALEGMETYRGTLRELAK